MPRGKRVTKYINAGMKKTKGKKILTKEIVKNGVKYKYRYDIRTKEWSVKRTFVDTGYVPIKRKPTAIRIKPRLRRAAFLYGPQLPQYGPELPPRGYVAPPPLYGPLRQNGTY